jgi:shikimate kinase
VKIYFIGPSGSGKTVIGKRVADALSFSYIDTDAAIIKVEAARGIAEIFERKGEDCFRARERALIHRTSRSKRSTVVSTGGGLPAIDGTMQRMLSTGVVIYLRARVKTLWSRLEVGDELRDRPLLSSNGIEELRRLCKLREPHYVQAHLTIDTDRFTVEKTVKVVLEAICEDE